MPVSAGPIAAPATAVATCDSATTQKTCDAKMIIEARTVQMPSMMTQARLCLVSSIKAPAGAVITMPATPPIVMTEPIDPLCQPWAMRKTPRNGPMPA
jgi:hypothetical protein